MFSRAVLKLNMLLLILIITGLCPVAAQQEETLGNARPNIVLNMYFSALPVNSNRIMT